MLGGELFGAFGYKINVRTFAKNLARRPHWIAQSLDAADASSPQRGAIHDERIQLHFAVAIQKTSAPASKVSSSSIMTTASSTASRD